ncbi:hypothetical protein [Roseinatronobacter alkalisoli]|uniref:Ankyrin repeat domain-containing protein n=1 Tax=Roseinatronobacter alkalisoli TaxID=3028235 RepID=A0ABT5TDZ3_9RHOB|nr:hypothetical protein [Roseinatronobacter sp. HJB301]MDD7973236.1 hypothetical protein [Roseinatronobacter sp. HJB301]
MVAMLVALVSSISGVPVAKSQIDITANGPDGLPGVFWLIKQRDRAAVEAWLDAGGDIEAQGFHRATPILAAAIVDNWPMVLYLIERGARMDLADGRGYTLPYRANSTRVDTNGIFGSSLNAVRAHLAQAGLLSQVYTPEQVRAMMAEGKWPPAP